MNELGETRRCGYVEINFKMADDIKQDINAEYLYLTYLHVKRRTLPPPPLNQHGGQH